MVVGVHSAKFMAERATENLREAVLRYGVVHPVVNDRDFAVWNAYGVRAWPTLIFVAPDGALLAKHEGEAPLEALEPAVSRMLAEFRRKGLIDTSRPLPLRAESTRQAPLAFPGKVAVDRGRLAVSDTNHGRVVLATIDGEVQAVFDGFDRPQGVYFVGDHLYVADVASHTVNRLELGSGRLERLAGTGRAAMSHTDLAAGALRSPWDVCWLEGHLYVAMAGTHQVWRYDLRSGELRPWAGSGREGLQDGPLESAWLAQPSGLATDGRALYVADSEVSAVRRIDVAEGRVETLVGKGLFEFGDQDGPPELARLQHPLGVAAGGDCVYVADSYNNKIKRLSLLDRSVRTLAGTGEQGMFNEPGGLALGNGLLYVADTNNHRVRVVDTDSGEVRDLILRGL